MKTTSSNLDNIGKINPFKVPVGYFEGFCDNMMSQLPEKENKKPQVVGLWERVKPWVYMAAMVAGIMLMINIFVNKSDSSGIFSKDVKNIPISEIDDFDSYYQEKMAYSSYQQALYDEEDSELL
ncbi:MAG: hypothetical protein FWD60_05110 [Candidatus Azobacteroides sp.]|nr:hypothetical protein [Candidatus Azobacteroides sp.]